MQEIQGDIFSYLNELKSAIVIPTNNALRQNGNAVMGAGLARKAFLKFHSLEAKLGEAIRTIGPVVHKINDEPTIFAFPTKVHFNQKASLELIQKSASELMTLTIEYDKVYLPRVGAGLGGLKWDIVKKILEPILVEEKYIIVNYE